MNGLPYVAFYFGDFVAGVRVFTTEEVGAYILLLGYQWINGPLPDNQADLDRIAGVTVTERVRNKFQSTKSGLVNSRLERERAKGIAKKEKALKRVHKFREKTKGGVTRYNPVTETLQKRFCSDSDSLLPLGNSNIPEVEKTNSPKEVAERIWKHYPHKAGRPRALKYIERDLKAGTLEADILAGVKRYDAFMISEHARGFARGYKDGGAFFNDRMWEAEWKIVAAGQQAKAQPGGMNSNRIFSQAASDAHTEYHIKALGIE